MPNSTNIASDGPPGGPYLASVVLRTESKDEFAKLVEELNQEIKPTSFIERMYVEDVAYLVWEIIRLRRVKLATINKAFFTALKAILPEIQFPGASGRRPDLREKADKLADQWSFNPEVRGRILGLLQEAGLDESSVEAEAFRLSIDDIEKLDRALTLAEVRRDKAIRMIAEYKDSFAIRLRQSAERVLAVDNVPGLEYRPPEN